MGRGAQKVGAVILLLIIVVVGIRIYQTLTNRGAGRPPKEVLDAWRREQLRVLDTETGQMKTLTRFELNELPERDGRWQNPETKAYTLALPMTCASCGATVPLVEPPAELTTSVWESMKGAPSEELAAREQQLEKAEAERLEKLAAWRKAQLCPKCGKPLFAVEPPPEP